VFKNEILNIKDDEVKQSETKLLSEKIENFYVIWSISKDIQTSLVYLSGRQITNEQLINRQLQQSEETSRNQFKNMPFPTYTWKRINDDFILADFNDVVFHETEGKVQHLVGIKASELLTNNKEILDDMNTCFETHQTIKKEIKYLLINTGEDCYYSVTIAFVPPEYIIIHMEDITLKKLIEIEIMENEEKYRKLYNTRQDAIVLVSTEGKVLEYNDSVLDLFNYSSKELIHKYIYELIMMAHKHDDKDVISHAEGFILDLFNKSMVDGFVEVVCLKKNQETFPAEVQTQFIKIKEKSILILF
jgi:PAS domain S-box-containing protein